MPSLPSIQQILDPLFPGLMGLRLVEVSPERVVAQIDVRPDLCTNGGAMHGGAIMAFADTLGAVGTFMNMPRGKRTTTTSGDLTAARCVCACIVGQWGRNEGAASHAMQVLASDGRQRGDRALDRHDHLR